MSSPSGSSSSESSSECAICKEPVDRWNSDTWKQVIGFVGGPKKDHMRLREDTGVYAHDHCVMKLASGQAADQEDLFSGSESVDLGREKEMPSVFDNDSC